MKARHKDTGEIIELAEEGIISCDGRRYCWYQVELLPEPVDEVQPSLPSNLDEAAEESMPEAEGFLEVDIYGGSEAVYSREQMLAMYKAGAEWMAGQGVTKETQVYANRWTDVDEVIVNLGQGEYGFKAGDKVIVQIRRK